MRTKQGGFRHQEIEVFTRQEGDGLLLERELLANLTDDGRTIVQGTSFNEVPEWLNGREDSAHEVQFGNLELKASDGKSRQIPVAMKPFQVFRAGASNEAAALLKVQE